MFSYLKLVWYIIKLKIKYLLLNTIKSKNCLLCYAVMPYAGKWLHQQISVTVMNSHHNIHKSPLELQINIKKVSLYLV